METFNQFVNLLSLLCLQWKTLNLNPIDFTCVPLVTGSNLGLEFSGYSSHYSEKTRATKKKWCASFEGMKSVFKTPEIAIIVFFFTVWLCRKCEAILNFCPWTFLSIHFSWSDLSDCGDSLRLGCWDGPLQLLTRVAFWRKLCKKSMLNVYKTHECGRAWRARGTQTQALGEAGWHPVGNQKHHSRSGTLLIVQVRQRNHSFLVTLFVL